MHNDHLGLEQKLEAGESIENEVSKLDYAGLPAIVRLEQKLEAGENIENEVCNAGLPAMGFELSQLPLYLACAGLSVLFAFGK